MPEPDRIEVIVNGAAISVDSGTTVAAAILMSTARTRTSITGEPRAPLCGMGICYECCVTINGVPHQKSCQILCQSGMKIETS